MKPVERFFRKYFLSITGIIVLFLLLNIVLFFFALIWAWQTSETPKLPLNEICGSIVMDEAGHFTTSEELAELLEEHHAWAMLLDDKGAVIFQKRMPEELPHRYTPADVAKFDGTWMIILSMCRSIPRDFW